MYDMMQVVQMKFYRNETDIRIEYEYLGWEDLQRKQLDNRLCLSQPVKETAETKATKTKTDEKKKAVKPAFNAAFMAKAKQGGR